MPSLTYIELFRGNRNFRNLLAGQFISELGNWFNFIAGLGLVRLVSEASPTAAGLFFVARMLPFAIAFLLVTSAEDLWIAYAATILMHTFGAFFDGAKNAAAPNLTGKEGLLAG